ncbi:hypothetical protein [Salinarimonas sp.]|uniref:hypothetical protein n=1 Tax=Salinarimonas sp. TaxID=2766526 RepID=UPI00391A0752
MSITIKASLAMATLVAAASAIAALSERMASTTAPLSPEALAALYATPLPPPEGPLAVFHLGHSLVGRDMPRMLAAMAPVGHRYASQLGWGTTLQAHWRADAPIPGFETVDLHPLHEDVHGALDSGDFDVLVLTEMVELRDAIRHFDSPRFLRAFAERALAGNPAIRVYLYETWHRLDDPEGFLERIDRDLPRAWEGELLARAQAGEPLPAPIRVVPAGQAIAAVVRAAEDGGGIEGVAGRADLFVDDIHPSPLGNWVVALAHYATLYGSSPVDLPPSGADADGTPMPALTDAASRRIREIVWEVVSSYPKSGVATPGPLAESRARTP